jgi:hypothetical protein
MSSRADFNGTYAKIVLLDKRVRGNLVLVRSDVGELVKVVLRNAVDLRCPDSKATEIGNGQRVTDDKASGVLGQGSINAREPRVPRTLCNLREDLSALDGVLLGVCRAREGASMDEGRRRPINTLTDVLDVGEELFDLEGRKGVPRVQAGKLASEDENGIGLRELHPIHLQDRHLAILEASGGLGASVRDCKPRRRTYLWQQRTGHS